MFQVITITVQQIDEMSLSLQMITVATADAQMTITS